MKFYQCTLSESCFNHYYEGTSKRTVTTDSHLTGENLADMEKGFTIHSHPVSLDPSPEDRISNAIFGSGYVVGPRDENVLKYNMNPKEDKIIRNLIKFVKQ